jgi:hypothetical protein
VVPSSSSSSSNDHGGTSASTKPECEHGRGNMVRSRGHAALRRRTAGREPRERGLCARRRGIGADGWGQGNMRRCAEEKHTRARAWRRRSCRSFAGRDRGKRRGRAPQSGGHSGAAQGEAQPGERTPQAGVGTESCNRVQRVNAQGG